MVATETRIEDLIDRDYEHGFYTDIEADVIPRGLNEDGVRLISTKKNETVSPRHGGQKGKDNGTVNVVD